MTNEQVKALLERAVRETNGTHTAADVVDELAKGRLHLWIGKACIGVTEILVYPRKTGINIFLAAGDMAEFRTLQPAIEAYGRGKGATFLTFHGRATRAVAKRCGWGRSGEGFKPGWVMYTKEL